MKKLQVRYSTIGYFLLILKKNVIRACGARRASVTVKICTEKRRMIENLSFSATFGISRRLFDELFGDDFRCYRKKLYFFGVSEGGIIARRLARAYRSALAHHVMQTAQGVRAPRKRWI